MPSESGLPCFVISLADCADRRANISRLLEDLGMPFEFVDAVDGRNGLAPEHEAMIDRDRAARAGVIMSDAEYACALSHIEVCRRVAESGIDWALILEDDAVPLPDLKQFLANRGYEDADITQLMFHRAWVRRRGDRPLFGSYRSYILSRLKSPSATGYVVSNKAARQIHAEALPVAAPADWPRCVDRIVAEGRFRVVHPHLVQHAPCMPGQSILSRHGRAQNKERRRFLGVYIPPPLAMLRSYARALNKLGARRIPS